MKFNPIQLAEEVEQRYRQYLLTTFFFKDLEFRKSFSDALKAGHLSKGPYLEATSIFQKGDSPKNLFPKLIGNNVDEAFLKAIDGNRELYLHQEAAINKVFRGDNIIVATGTGSGKTESFLYPILLHLYQEFINGTLCPGVRALILYPMNALANDQRERLVKISENLKNNNSAFNFTFGQYIGETPEDENDSFRNAKDRKHGELIFRKEMRENPPHILLTNYSMLEYLLIRPSDSQLFDNGRAEWWKFLVLDEAHQYRGANGIEMGMLIRRLKQRLIEGGRREKFRFIATSATLAGGDADKPAVAKFATDLFGEKFNDQDVILGTSVQFPEKVLYKLSEDDYQIMLTVIHNESNEDNSSLFELSKKLNIGFNPQEEISTLCGKILKHDERAIHLRRLITGKPLEFENVAVELFPELLPEIRSSAMSSLVEVLQFSKDDAYENSMNPLLSIRYHFFLRSLEGAFISYLPQKKVFLDRKKIEGSALFEVALCRNCGQHYLVGKKVNNHLLEAVRDPGDEEFGVTFYCPLDQDNDYRDDIEDEKNNKNELNLCVICGAISRDNLKCGHENSIKVIEEESPKNEDRADQIAKCSVCGYSASGRDPVKEIVHGHDGPNAVIATTLYQHLPETRKKVLAFADSRQEAAFFAWYLESSYKEILNRNLILKVLRELNAHTDEGLSLNDVATRLKEIYREKSIFPETYSELQLKRESWLRIYRELLTDETRISLEGVGLIKWQVKLPQQFEIPEILTKSPWFLSNQEAFDLLSILLDTMRSDRAVELHTEPGVSINWNDLNIQAYQMRIRVGKPGKQKNVKSWDSPKAKRGRFLTKVLKKINPEMNGEDLKQKAEAMLRNIWEHFEQFDKIKSYNADFLISVDDGRRLNPDWWRIFPISENEKIFQCDTCGRLQSIGLRGVCPESRCKGNLLEKTIGELEQNHYRLLYLERLPGILRSEEHTAQLSPEKARQFQKDFVDGKIHVLSSSTTFELGVDLGDLDLVFLRNIPPEAFNYAQRVGRTGRRVGFPGFAISYCRRNPHDIYHFNNPEKIIKGKIRPPVLSIQNEKIILRHVTAIAFSLFFRKNRHRFYDQNDKSRIKQLFGNLQNPNGVADFKNFLHQLKNELLESLRSIVPAKMYDAVGFSDYSWIEKITGRNEYDNGLSIFLQSEIEIASDYNNVKKLEEDSKNKSDYKTAEWAKKRAATIAKEDVLSYLSRKAIIPKYGFPVDVVELDVQKLHNYESSQVSLQRDLSIAISEFAPTSKIIANKKEWESAALKKVAEKEWEIKYYKKCSKHNFFTSWNYGEEQKEKDCCDLVPSKFVIPKFGFITKREKAREPKGRLQKLFSTKPYFVGLSTDENIGFIDFGFMKFWKACPGKMVVLCEGKRNRGFYICPDCGTGFQKYQNSHKSPNGHDCRGTLSNMSLGHEFITDVIKFQFEQKNYQFQIESVWLAYSLAYAILSGTAEILEVPPNDLNATVGYSSEEHALPPIILYDSVPGGAGLVARLEDKNMLYECLSAAKDKINGGCGCDSSCYGCLRNYRNQFAHQKLSRRFAYEFFAQKLILEH